MSEWCPMNGNSVKSVRKGQLHMSEWCPMNGNSVKSVRKGQPHIREWCPMKGNSVKARGGGVKVDFPVFTYLIRAAGDEQEEKNRTEI